VPQPAAVLTAVSALKQALAMKNNFSAPLAGVLVFTLAVVCTGRTLHTADFFLP
jgi:hypothetical protein